MSSIGSLSRHQRSFPKVTRRNFLRASGLLGAATFLPCIQARISCEGAQQQAPTKAGAASSIPAWVERPMRWAQLTLVEDDPGKFDPSFWLDYFKRTHSDGVCLSAGGCVAFYPTEIPFHHRSAWLGDTDPFGALVTGCRQMGMVVLARTDPHATYDDVQQAHPDWIAVDAAGKPRRHWASPEMWVTCALGPYNFDFMTRVHREVTERYKPEGIFINRWDGSGMCYCQHCRENFRAASGFELPRTSSPRDPVRRAYILWRQRRLFELWQLWDAEVRKISPESRVIPNTGGGANSSLDMKEIGALAETLMADRQARRGLAAPWSNGRNSKEYRATMGRKPIVGIFSVGVEEPYRWKDSVQSDAEIRIWVADGVANGLRPWFTKFSGVLHDQRWLGTVESIYRRLHGWEKYLRNEEPLARVGLVYSQQTAWFYPDERLRDKVEDPSLGWYQALIEARIPFEMIHDRLLDQEHLQRVKTLILPNIAALSDEQCQQLTAFVESGGGLVATYETSLLNEWGDARADFGLSGLFGVRYSGRAPGPMQNSYLRLERSGPDSASLLKGLENAPRIINGVHRLEVEAVMPARPPLTLIPSYPDLPMEKVYPRVDRTELGQLFLNQRGQGRVAYFPWDIDRTFWEVLNADHGRLMTNAVAWCTNEPPLIAVTGPGVLDVTVWRQKRSLCVHLVNLTNPMMMKGPYRELIPVDRQEVVLRVPADFKPGKVRLLAAKTTPRLKRSRGEIAVTVPSILDHEVIAIDQA